MATHILDAFLIKFGIETSEFEDSERDIRDRSKRLREDSKKTFDGMEVGSKKFGSSIKNVRNEVVGLGLAFMGARSITDMIGNMMTGAASAERLGTTMGMTTRQVWSWRQAMKGVGGQNGDADAALQSIQKLRMAFQQGQIDPASSGILSRLGISGNDLRSSNPGDILRKLSGAQSRMDPQLFSSLLSQIGLSGPVTYFLMKGQSAVESLLKEFEGSADEQEKLAKQTEELQVELARLNTQVQQALVPVLVQMVPLLTDLVGGIKELIDYLPHASPKASYRPETRQSHPQGWTDPNLRLPGEGPQSTPQNMSVPRAGMPSPSKRGTSRADRNNNPGNIEDGSFARRQTGYAGSDGRFARFTTPQQGFDAMVRLLNGSGYRGQGRDTIDSVLRKYAPASENNVSAYAANVEKQTGFNRHQHLNQVQMIAVAKAMARHEGFHGDIKIQSMTVQTKDASSFQRDMRAQVRRHAVAKADPGVRP